MGTARGSYCLLGRRSDTTEDLKSFLCIGRFVVFSNDTQGQHHYL